MLHAGVMCGELKHGPLALVDKTFPLLLIMPPDKTREVRRSFKFEVYFLFLKKALTYKMNSDSVIFFTFTFDSKVDFFLMPFFFQKTQTALQQIRARGGQPILMCEEGDPELKDASQYFEVPGTVDCLQGKDIFIAFLSMNINIFHINKPFEK